MPLNSNWEFVDSSTQVWERDHVFGFRFKFKRKPHYYVLNLCLPAAILTILQLSSFLIPSKEIERSTFSATNMLAMFILHSTTESYLPISPNPVLAYHYALGVLSFGTISTVSSAFLYFLTKHCRQTMNRKIYLKTLHLRVYTVLDIVVSILLTVSAIIFNIAFVVVMSKSE